MYTQKMLQCFFKQLSSSTTISSELNLSTLLFAHFVCRFEALQSRHKNVLKTNINLWPKVKDDISTSDLSSLEEINKIIYKQYCLIGFAFCYWYFLCK